MDQANRWETKNTYLAHRAEYFVLWVITTVLLIIHITEVNWIVALALFFYIDLIGYIPGAIAWHRSPTKRISKNYYRLYNLMHSLITQTVVVGVWGLAVGWEWALLVVPFHIFGDRALFGNFLKPYSVSFEPVTHPAFAAVADRLERYQATDPPVTDPPVTDPPVTAARADLQTADAGRTSR